MTKNKSLVAIIMGSDSDWPIMKHAAQVLDDFNISYEAQVVSAHRTPDLMVHTLILIHFNIKLFKFDIQSITITYI